MRIRDWFRGLRRVKDEGKAIEEALIEEAARKRIKAEREKRESEQRERDIQAKTDELRGQEARGRGGSPINITSIVKVTKERHFWLAFLLWVIFIFILLYLGAYKNVLPSWLKIEFNFFKLVVYSGAFIFIGYIITGFISSAVNKDKEIKITNFWVALALLVWLWDLAPPYIGPIKIPWGGINFQGFVWNFPLGTFSTTWLSILTSSAMLHFYTFIWFSTL